MEPLLPEKRSAGRRSTLCRTHRLRIIELIRRKELAVGANGQFLCSRSDKHKLRSEQHTELGDDRSHKHRHHARDIYVGVGEWFHQRQPDGDHYLHANCDQRGGLEYRNCKSHRDRGGRSADDRNNVVSGWNAGRGICRMHRCRKRRHSAIHLFHQHQRQLSSVA